MLRAWVVFSFTSLAATWLLAAQYGRESLEDSWGVALLVSLPVIAPVLVFGLARRRSVGMAVMSFLAVFAITIAAMCWVPSIAISDENPDKEMAIAWWQGFGRLASYSAPFALALQFPRMTLPLALAGTASGLVFWWIGFGTSVT